MKREEFEEFFSQPRPPVTAAGLLYVGIWAFILGCSFGLVGAMALMGRA